MRVKILGQYWTIRWVPALGRGDERLDGDACHETKQLRISHGNSEEDELETIIHEFMHAADPSRREWWVSQASHDLRILLTKLGYKKCP